MGLPASSQTADGRPGRGGTWWAPRARGWWIGILFASARPSSPSARYPATPTSVGDRADSVTFFVGSLFFTRPASSSTASRWTPGPMAPPGGWKRVLAYRPRQIDWWATAIQLVGTVFFNVSTGNALRIDLSSQAAHQHIWRPDAFGSVCFLVASGLAWFEVCHGWLAWSPRSLAWWITLANLVGSVAFGVSAVAAYIVPSTGQVRNVELSNLGTFVGRPVLPRWRRPPPARTDRPRRTRRLSPAQPRSGAAPRSGRGARSAPRTRRTSRAPRPRGGGGRAQVDVLERRPVRVPLEGRTEHGLDQAGRAPGDVAAHVVGVVPLLVGRGQDRAGQDQVREPGCEPLDLGLDGRRHVHVGAGGDVAVPPQRLLAVRGPGGIGHPGLDDDAVGTVRVPAGLDVGLAGRHLGERAAEVHGPGPAADLGAPGDGSGQRPVDLADAGAVAESTERPAVAGRGATVPAMSTRLLGDVSSTTAVERGSSASEPTHWPVVMVPPSRSSSATMASVMAELPPPTTGQPTAWAVMARRVPNALVRGAVSDIEWAADTGQQGLGLLRSEPAHQPAPWA